ncbi:hypothetical protein A9236_02505 [Polynucleobacter sp. QLW-P1DATA-2]|uniref:hypothetical protein n=1 Tax=unclassified Polynucleobacter TaxID=2640945 RepID=UPI0008F8673D|nr:MULTISPECIES: hypothetical protein [unclassified Polynucleobacter]OIN03007.1 hypothetical protein A9236_02505 [Polynucleobacter sp. QLW-P1DATA-2]OIN03032.1 hypothetical protein A9235_00015 [Polynucleobacter sp. MWH-Tro8-2-5-gr]
MQDSPSTFAVLKDIINSEIKKQDARLSEYEKLISTELNLFKQAFESEYVAKRITVNFEPVLHKNSPSIRVQISNPSNSFVIHILLDSYSAPFLVGHKATSLAGTQEGGEIAKNCEEIKKLLIKRIEANTVSW